MNYRALGRTGLEISEISFGAWGIGGGMWQGSRDGESTAALHKAVDLGVNFIDTALAYGDGHSERLVGKFLRERKEKIFVATKIPPKNQRWPARSGTPLADAFPGEYIVRCTEESLKNLGADTIDVQQFHVWDDGWAGAPEWQEAFERLKKEGKIRFAGISINDHQPSNALKAAATGKIDCFQVIYNIFDQSPEKELFPYCLEHKLGIIVRVPLDEGGLTGTISPETTFPDGDWRHHYFRGDRKAQVSSRATALQALLGKDAATLPELALRFCLQHRAVSTVIPGMRTALHAEMNSAVSDGKKLSAPLLAELRRHAWERNFYA
jgi:aryl-alcohol dehydrogenase-like predicted oxidoreductase